MPPVAANRVDHRQTYYCAVARALWHQKHTHIHIDRYHIHTVTNGIVTGAVAIERGFGGCLGLPGGMMGLCSSADIYRCARNVPELLKIFEHVRVCVWCVMCIRYIYYGDRRTICNIDTLSHHHRSANATANTNEVWISHALTAPPPAHLCVDAPNRLTVVNPTATCMYTPSRKHYLNSWRRVCVFRAFFGAAVCQARTVGACVPNRF